MANLTADIEAQYLTAISEARALLEDACDVPSDPRLRTPDFFDKKAPELRRRLNLIRSALTGVQSRAATLRYEQRRKVAA
jgi:hypothetical protein